MCVFASDFFYKMVNISLVGDDVNDYMHHNKIRYCLGTLSVMWKGVSVCSICEFIHIE